MAYLVLTLAQICVWEAGFAETDDCPAIAQVLRTRGLDTPPEMLRYARGLQNPRRRRWVRHLDLEARRPRHWPRHLSWERYIPRWRARITEAERILATRPQPCPRGTRHYAQRGWTHPKGTWRGWVRASCGYTMNAFWRKS